MRTREFTGPTPHSVALMVTLSNSQIYTHHSFISLEAIQTNRESMSSKNGSEQLYRYFEAQGT